MNWIDHVLLHYLHYLLSKNVHIYTISSKLETLRELLETFDKIPLPDELEEWLKTNFECYITRRKYKRVYEDFVEFLVATLSLSLQPINLYNKKDLK